MRTCKELRDYQWNLASHGRAELIVKNLESNGQAKLSNKVVIHWKYLLE